MKKILLLFLILFGGSQIYSQQVNRIRFYQLPKDVNNGSVLISSPTDSNITFSRDLYVNYNLTDTLLIFNGDTVAVTSTLPSLLNNYVTISGTETIAGTKTFTSPIIGDLEGVADTALRIFTLPSGDNVDYVLTMVNPSEGFYVYNRTLNNFTYNPFTYMLKAQNYHFNTGQDTTGSGGDVLTYRNGQISLEPVSVGSTFTYLSEVGDVVTVDSGSDLNVDGNTFYVDGGINKVGVNLLPTTLVHNLNVNTDMGLFRYSDVAYNESIIAFNRSRGTESTKTVVQQGDVIGELLFSGYDGNGWDAGARIAASVSAEPVTGGDFTDMPMDLYFSTASDGSNIPTERMRITQSGNIGVGTSTPDSKFEINGSATNTTANNEGSDATIDFSLSNISYTSSTSSTITLSNIKDGGSYTLIMTGSASTAVTFSATNFTFKYMGTVDRTSGKQHIYSFIVVGSNVYVTMGTEN